jgi:hypothetical protein
MVNPDLLIPRTQARDRKIIKILDSYQYTLAGNQIPIFTFAIALFLPVYISVFSMNSSFNW